MWMAVQKSATIPKCIAMDIEPKMSSSALAARWKLSVYLCGRTAKLVIVDGAICWWMRGYASNPIQRMEALLLTIILGFAFLFCHLE